VGGFPYSRRIHRRYPPKFARPGLNARFNALGDTQNFDLDHDIRSDHGAMAAWVRPLHAPADGNPHFYILVGPTIPGMGLSYISIAKMGAAMGNMLQIRYDDGAGGLAWAQIAAAGNLTQNVWHFIAGSWAPDRMNLWLDGAHVAENIAAVPVGGDDLSQPSNFVVGSFGGLIFAANADIAAPRAWPYEIPPSEYFNWVYNNERGKFGV